ncbi:MAG: hypothetical protein ACE5HD_00620 [Acidobacteriota bacterium]
MEKRSLWWGALVVLLWMTAVQAAPDPNEPNDDPSTATPIDCPLFVSTSAAIGPPADQDYFRLSGTAGSPLFIDIDAFEIGSNLDSALTLLDSGLAPIGFSDDDPAPGESLTTDSYLETFMPSDGQIFILVASFSDPNNPPTSGTYVLSADCLPPPGPLMPGDLLGSTGRAGASLIDIDPSTGAGTFRGRLGDFGPVTEIEFRDDGALLGAIGEGSGKLVDIDPAMGIETLRCTHDTGSLNGLEFVNGVLYGALKPDSFTPSRLVTVGDPDLAGHCPLTVLGPTGFGNLGGLAYDEGSGILYGCTSGGGGGDLVTCSLATGACNLIGATGFDDCAALEFGAQGLLFGGIGGRSAAAGTLITIDPSTGAGAAVGATGSPKLSGLSFVPGCAPRTLCNSPATACRVSPGATPQAVAFGIENPGSGFLTNVIGVDVEHNGLDLRTAPGADPAGKLGNRLSLLESLAEDAVSQRLAYTDTTFLAEIGEVVGYLAASESLCLGQDGSLGGGRGSVDASSLPPATP